jgi:hypothetical protein
MQCDFECESCQHIDHCDKPAAIEYRAEVAAEHQTDPRICAECGCHGVIAERLAELEQDVAQVKGLLFGLAAFFERMGAS